jgi:hypothetical protein
MPARGIARLNGQGELVSPDGPSKLRANPNNRAGKKNTAARSAPAGVLMKGPARRGAGGAFQVHTTVAGWVQRRWPATA